MLSNYTIKMQFKGVLHPEMPDILFFLISRYFYNLNFKYMHIHSKVGVKYSTCTWYLYLSTYLSVLEYLVYGNVKVLVLVLVLDQKVLGTYK